MNFQGLRTGSIGLGIASRLTLSIAAVVLLAATANWIARESVRVIRTITHAQTMSPQPPKLPVQAALAPLPPPPIVKSGSSLSPVLERYGQAVRERSASDSPEARADYAAAKEALQIATLDANRDAAPGIRATLRSIPLFVEQGEVLIDVGDRRRAARNAYLDHARAIADRIQTSLAHAWTVFGRVIAQQSLIQMRGTLDVIKQRSEALLMADGSDQAALDDLAAGEAKFAGVVERNADGLRKSQGTEWLSAIRDQFHDMVGVRESIVNLDRQYHDHAGRFGEQGRSLSKQMTVALRGDARLGADVNAGVDTGPAGAMTPAVESASIAPAERIETEVRPTDPGAPRLMALMTAFVMALIVVISVWIVRSIVIPVRRLVEASRRLAGGETGVFVARGGIEELDLVAEAFNEMSTNLGAMHRARQDREENLETLVAERTHKLQKLAQQDPLTSLPNRRQLKALLDAAIERAARDGHFVGVYFLDIDNFKNINDSVGHRFGDRVLMSVANRLEELADGIGFVARLGGDEFTIVYESADSTESIREFGLGVAKAFHSAISVDDRDLTLSVSVGASIFPLHESDADALLRAADSALFRAKELGRSQLALFTPELIVSAAKRFAIEQGLRRAIERSEFELAYQPEIDLATGEVGLVEALLRWRLPDGRLALPGEFLAVAEQSGIISEIDAWVLRAAIADVARWYHGGWPDARVAINISARQLLDRRFVERATDFAKESKIPNECIEFELTEIAFQTNSTTIAALRLLRSQGFGIALDDFGTGYSSLTSLAELPLTRIKLDRSLIAQIESSERSAAIGRAVLDLCAGLDLELTAEGIERAEQFAWFMDHRSISLQGFLLSEAVPFDQVLAVKDGLVGKVQDLFLASQALSLDRVERHRMRPPQILDQQGSEPLSLPQLGAQDGGGVIGGDERGARLDLERLPAGRIDRVG